MSKNGKSMHANLLAYNFTQGTQEGMLDVRGIGNLGYLTEAGETQVNQEKADDRSAVFVLSLKVTANSSAKPLWLELRLTTPLIFFVMVGLYLQRQTSTVSTHPSKTGIHLNNACHKS